jgi:hypothetical protein
VDRLTRKELKKDKFAQEVGHTVEYLEHHKRQLVLYGSIAVAVVVLVAGLFYYNRHQHTVRQQELRAAIATMEAPIGPSPAPGVLTFSTQADKERAVTQTLTALVTRHSGSDEATIAQYYLGALALNQGKFDEAARLLKVAADSSATDYAALAKYTLAQVDATQGKTADADKMLRDLIAKPSLLVSKEEATLALARLLAPTRPDEARKLLEPLRTAPGAAGRAATATLADLGANK